MVHGPEDVEALAACARLPGLTVRTAAAVELARLDRLVALDGDLLIGPTLAVTSVSLPALAEVGGKVRIAGNGDLTAVILPALVKAGPVEIVDNASLATVSLPALREVAGPVVLRRLPGLEIVDTTGDPRLDGGLDVGEVPRLGTWLGVPAAKGPVRLDAPRLDAETRAAIDPSARTPE